MDKTKNDFKSEVDVVLAGEVDNAFYRARLLDAVTTLLRIEFTKYSVDIDTRRGELFIDAVETALGKYKEAVQLESSRNTSELMAKLNQQERDKVLTAVSKKALE